jgi:hypothetical protein
MNWGHDCIKSDLYNQIETIFSQASAHQAEDNYEYQGPLTFG